ncbi:hypothetical protein BDV06DRAFT_214091 [Aspergillus oleicola]
MPSEHVSGHGWGIAYVYEVNPHIVVKVPQSGECEEEQFQNEVRIYDILSKYPACPYLIDCFHYCENGIFLEYMKGIIQQNHTKDLEAEGPHRSVNLKVNRYEPLPFPAFLESIGLAHGDLRPENVLIDGDNIELSDFDIAGEIGTPLKYMYGDRILGENYYDAGQKLEELLRTKQFPELNRDLAIDTVIYMCWHNRYKTIAQLAAHTESLLATYFKNNFGADRPATNEVVTVEKALCQDLENRGLPKLLCSGAPEELGFSLEWYRYSKSV